MAKINPAVGEQNWEVKERSRKVRHSREERLHISLRIEQGESNRGYIAYQTFPLEWK